MRDVDGTGGTSAFIPDYGPRFWTEVTNFRATWGWIWNVQVVSAIVIFYFKRAHVLSKVKLVVLFHLKLRVFYLECGLCIEVELVVLLQPKPQVNCSTQQFLLAMPSWQEVLPPRALTVRIQPSWTRMWWMGRSWYVPMMGIPVWVDPCQTSQALLAKHPVLLEWCSYLLSRISLQHPASSTASHSSLSLVSTIPRYLSFSGSPNRYGIQKLWESCQLQTSIILVRQCLVARQISNSSFYSFSRFD